MDLSHENSAPSMPISVLKACMTCHRAKAKCVPRQEADGKCQRCYRLEKACEPSIAQARAQPRKRNLAATARGRKSHVEKLEQKLDGLVTLLKSQQNLNPTVEEEVTSTSSSLLRAPTDLAQSSSHLDAPAQHTNQLDFSQPPPTESQNNGWPSQIPTSQQLEPPDLPSCSSEAPEYHAGPTWTGQGWYTYRLGYPVTGPSITTPQVRLAKNPLTDVMSSFVPTWEGADGLLNRFREELYPGFPFVLIPDSVTAEELQRERPFLYLCVLAVSSRNPNQQSELGKSIMKQLAEKMFINGERSMDLLLGVLTYSAWCYYHFWNVPQLTSLLGASMTLIWDLGLAKPLPNAPPTRSLFEEAIKEASTLRYLTLITNGRTIEERRAFIGCLVLSSVIFVFFRRTPAVTWTSYFEECLQVLFEADHPHDRLAVALSRLQIIGQRIHESLTPWHDKPQNANISSTTMFIMNSLEEQLKRFYKDAPKEAKQSAIFLMHYHSTEISLYEIGLTNQQPQISDYGPQFQRLEALYGCLQACKSFFEVFLSMSAVAYVSFSLASWSQVTNGLIILQLLSSFEHPDWNLDYVRQTLDFDDVLNRIVAQLGNIESHATPGEPAIVFSRMGMKIAAIQRYIAGKGGPVRPSDDHQGIIDPEIGRTGAEFSDFLDDDWLRDILGPFEYQPSMNLS